MACEGGCNDLDVSNEYMRLAEQQTRRLGRTDPSIMPQLSRSGDRPEMLVGAHR